MRLRRRIPRIVVAVLAALVASGLSGCTPVLLGTFDAAPTGSPTAEAPQRVLLFGDSYTAGVGADVPTDGYAYLVGGLTGWSTVVDGVAGTGYLNPAGSKGTYRQRLEKSDYGDDFDLVVLQGSSNDKGRPDLPAAVTATVSTARALFPGARIVLLGPVSFTSPPGQDRAEIDDDLSDASATLGLTYISPIEENWFTSADRSTLVNPADDHPNAAGYARISLKLVADLEALNAG